MNDLTDLRSFAHTPPELEIGIHITGRVRSRRAFVDDFLLGAYLSAISLFEVTWPLCHSTGLEIEYLHKLQASRLTPRLTR